jgi:polyisoprenoid-binding protein YceI
LQQYTVADDTAAATGTITIHGVTQPISLDIELTDSPEGTRGIGQTEIDMTAFGLTPPSLWGGLLSVGEMVQIQFDAPMPSAP